MIFSKTSFKSVTEEKKSETEEAANKTALTRTQIQFSNTQVHVQMFRTRQPISTSCIKEENCDNFFQ